MRRDPLNGAKRSSARQCKGPQLVVRPLSEVGWRPSLRATRQQGEKIYDGAHQLALFRGCWIYTIITGKPHANTECRAKTATCILIEMHHPRRGRASGNALASSRAATDSSLKSAAVGRARQICSRISGSVASISSAAPVAERLVRLGRSVAARDACWPAPTAPLTRSSTSRRSIRTSRG